MVATLYTVLGVPKDAEAAVIARAYRQLALQLHPDRNPNGAEQFKKVTDAYAVLSDPEKRAIYDLTGAIPDATVAEAFGRSNEAQRSAEIAHELSEFYKTYRGSDEERDDAARAFKATRGSFASMVREHLLFDNGVDGEVERLHKLVEELIAAEHLEATSKWVKTTTPAALRKLAKELSEERALAEKMLAKMGHQPLSVGDRNASNGGSGALVIDRKQRLNEWENFTDSLMAKYANPSAKKSKKK